jgi:taurine dioxygenase
MLANSIEVRPSGGGVGAFIEGVDLGQIDDTMASSIRTALGEFGVVFFRDQDITPEQHIAMAEAFGGVNINRFFGHVEGHEQIAEVRKEPDQKGNIGGGWHTDHTYDVIPAMGSILVARETPAPGVGGDTVFASMYAAYDNLSDGLKATLEGMNAVHSSRHVFGNKPKSPLQRESLKGRIGNQDAATQDAVHPVIIKHPISGKKAMYVNPGFTLHFEGWTEAESKPLLDYLYQQASKPENTYRFQWTDGSIAFWDNRASWHYALNDYHGHRRLMHRITVEGVPVGR